MTATVRTVDGRVAGRRGQATRTRLLECLHEMLGTAPYRDVTVIDVARMAGTSPATFYQYFPDIETAVIELANDMVRDGAELKELVGDRAWTGKAGFNNAEALVDGFLKFWQQHEPILRVVDLAASEGDKRFSRIRAKILSTVAASLADSISGTQKAGRAGEAAAHATAGVLVSMLAAVAAHQRGLDGWTDKPKDLKASLATMVYMGVTGRKPTR
jgi:AcrR family transcriptional regulator